MRFDNIDDIEDFGDAEGYAERMGRCKVVCSGT